MATNFVLAAVLVGFSSSLELQAQSDFDSWMVSQDRSYKKGSAEYQHRLELFSARMERAKEHNAKAGRLWTAGPGPLSDMSAEEVQQVKGWFGSATSAKGQRSPQRLRSGMFLNQQANDSLPTDFSWSHLKALQDAPDQGGCGSCWAVASALVLDAHAEIYHSRQTSFSAQELVDCVANKKHCGGDGGCTGATVELAMEYAMSTGLHTEDKVPYTGFNEECKPASLIQDDADNNDVQEAGVRKASHGAQGTLLYGMTAWEKLPENKYKPVLAALYNRGPVAVSVSADGWDYYFSGIYNSCGKDAIIDHAVTLIGWGQEGNHKYWTITNSWGNSFGENGKIRLLRQDAEEDYCGTDDQPELGTACKGGPASVRVCGQCGILYDNVVPHFEGKKTE